MWDITFKDGFFDPSKWIPGLWSHSPTNGGPGGRPDELQWYRPQNVSISNGILTLTAKREAYNGYTWTSGIVTTGRYGTVGDVKFKITRPEYYVESEIQVPVGVGTWSGFWAVAIYGEAPRPLKELDVLEQLGREPYRLYNTFHAPDSDSRKFDSLETLSTRFHLYGYRQNIDGTGQWYFDRRPINLFLCQDFKPDIPMYLLLNLAIGGWGGTPDPALTTAQMKIRRVTVWENL